MGHPKRSAGLPELVRGGMRDGRKHSQGGGRWWGLWFDQLVTVTGSQLCLLVGPENLNQKAS